MGVPTGSFISTDRRESTCACIDFSVDGDLIAGTNEGFAFPHIEDALCLWAVPVVQRRCSCSPLFEIAAVSRHAKF